MFRAAMRRMAEAADKQHEKKLKDKFGNQFNYAYSK